MNLTLICVPYDSGHRNVRMGAGPTHLIETGLVERLSEGGHSTVLETVEHEASLPAEISSGFELMGAVSERVSRALGDGRFPIVLSGNCNVSVGTISGLGQSIGVVWFDAHADFNTPETTTSGFFDGMGLAVLTGRCWRRLARGVPGYRPIAESDVVLAGAHDLDSAEVQALETSRVTVVPPEAFSDGAVLDSALARIAGRVHGFYLHLDPDVIDPSFGRANTYAAAGGISPAELQSAVKQVKSQVPILALGVASYDPQADDTGAIRDVVVDVVFDVVEEVGN